MTRQLTFELPDYRSVVVIDDTQYRLDSADNVTSYDSICHVPGRTCAECYAKRGVRLHSADGSSISLLVLFRGGGQLRETNVAIQGNRLYMSGGVSLCCIELTQLRVSRTVDLLTGANNGLQTSRVHDCIIAIGDFDVACLDRDGGILWATNVNCFLTSDSSIEGDVLSVYDDNGLKLVLDIKTGAKKMG